MSSLEKLLKKLLAEMTAQDNDELGEAEDSIVEDFQPRQLLEAIESNGLDDVLFGEEGAEFIVRDDALIVSRDCVSFFLTIKKPYCGGEAYDLAEAANIVLNNDAVELYRIDGDRRQPVVLSRFSIDELASLLRFHGNFWNLFFQNFYGIQILSQSFSIPREQRSVVVSKEVGGVRNESSIEFSALADLRAAFDQPNDRLIDIHEIFETQRKGAIQEYDCEHLSTKRISMFRYTPKRSSILDYGRATSGLTRTDKVVGYRAADRNFFREFVAGAKCIAELPPDVQRLVFDITHMLSIRRSKIYLDQFAKRVYSVIFPPVECLDQHIIVPTVSMNRRPRSGFSGTITISFWVLPLTNDSSEQKVRSRRAHIDEFFGVHNNFRQTFAQGNSYDQLNKKGIDSRSNNGFWQISPEQDLSSTLYGITEQILTQWTCHAFVPPPVLV